MIKCEQCKGKMKKIISQSSFHLKGTGWYVTDYASKKGSEGSKPAKEVKKEAKGPEDTPKKEAPTPAKAAE